MILAALLAVSTASAEISVPLRTDARADAPVAETVSLYKKSYALVIGNDTYTGPWPRLSNAVKDARLVKEALEAKGFEVTFRTNVTSREMVDAFEAFFLETGEDPDARLFVWYAGHGYSERGEGYLVPVDAPDTSEGGGSDARRCRCAAWANTPGTRSHCIYSPCSIPVSPARSSMWDATNRRP